MLHKSYLVEHVAHTCDRVETSIFVSTSHTKARFAMKYLKFPVTNGLKKDRYRTKIFARIPPEKMTKLSCVIRGSVALIVLCGKVKVGVLGGCVEDRTKDIHYCTLPPFWTN